MTDPAQPTTADAHTFVFRRSVPMQIRLQEILRALGNVDGLTCLEVGADNGAHSLKLRRAGGTWQSIAWDSQTVDALRPMLGESVHPYAEGDLPFKKKLFDVVVVYDFLERFRDDIAFIEECHKVLKPDGRLIVIVHRLGKWRPVDMLRSALGQTYQQQGFVRPGYTESELFRVLKSGFDVHVVRAYSRFWVELTDAIAARAMEKQRTAGESAGGRIARVQTIANFFLRIAFQLDALMLFSRGYRFISVAKRRAWRPRNAPVLSDGRTITEAVLSRAPA